MAINPYESSATSGAAPPVRRPWVTFWRLAAGAVLLFLLTALLLPLGRTAREPARRNHCQSNLKQIAAALWSYEKANGALPPAYTVDADGNRLHSWRTLLLPYLEESELYDRIDLTKPWDDPVNAFANEVVVDALVCPSSPVEEWLTTYHAVVGPDCVFVGAEPRKLSEVLDGTSKTVAVVDVDDRQAVPWMSPEDIGAEELIGLGPDSRTNHPGVLLAVFLDGRVELISDDFSQEERRAMLTIAGGEDASE